MSINNLNTYLNVRDAHLRVVSGNVYAQAMNIGGINVETAHGLQSVSDTGNVTSNTLQFSNATTGFVTTANVQIGRDLIVSGNATVSTDLTVSANATVTDTLTVSEHLIASKEATVTGNLHVTTIRSDSNVVAEYTGPHDRPLRKYPEVALTSSAINSDYKGYTIQRSSDYTVTYGTVEKLFNNADGSDVNSWVAGWNGTSGTYDAGTGEHSGTYHTPGSNNVEGTGAALFTGAPDGEWVSLQIPNGIRLDHVKIRARDHTDGVEQYPKDFEFWGSNNGTDWSLIKSFTNQSWPGQNNKGSYHVNSNILYNRIAMIITKIPPNVQYGTHCVFGQLEYYGYEEGSGSLDTTLKTVYNVPATTGTQLEVYYDAKDLTTMPSTVTDLSPNSNGGSVTGVTLDETGGINSFAFNGTSQYITASYSDLPNITDHTLAFWMKVDSTATNNDYVVTLGVNDNSSGGEMIAFNLTGGTSTGKVHFDNWGSGVMTTDSAYRVGEWVHVVGTMTGAATGNIETQFIYVNGIKRNCETTGTSTLNLTSRSEVTIGARPNNAGSGTLTYAAFFDGSIANVRFYSKALNADQVKELYDYQKDYFFGSKSQLTLYKGHLGIGVTEPSGQLELAGDERIQEYPPGPMDGRDSMIPGHGEFEAYASSEFDTSLTVDKIFDKTILLNAANRWRSSSSVYTPTTGGSPALTTSGSAKLATNTPYGQWIVLKLPYQTCLKQYNWVGMTTQDAKEGQIWGSNDGLSWSHVDSFTNGGDGWVTAGSNASDYAVYENTRTISGNTTYYSYYAFIITMLVDFDSAASIREIKFFGTPGPTTLDKGSLTLGRSLDVPRVSRYDVDTETPRPEKLLIDYDTTVNSSLTDISGKGNHGIFFDDAHWSAADKAFEFDGTDDYTQTAITIAGGNMAWTQSMWFKINAFPASSSTYAVLSFFGNKSSLSGHIMVYRNNEFWQDWYGNGVKANYTLEAGKWYHVVSIYHGNTSTDANVRSSIYINGVKQTLTWYSQTSSQMTLPTSTFYELADYINSSNVRHNGWISNPKFYTVALEPSEVRKLYNLGRTGRSMVISDTAVGIGKAPEAQLDVRGNLRVGGTIQVPLIISHRWINADTSVTNANYIPFNGVLYENPSGIHSGTIFTCPVKGIYECHFDSLTDNDGAWNGNHEWYLNGTYLSVRRRGYATNAGGNYHRQATSHYYIECNSGDTIGVVSAGTQTWYGHSGYSHSHMSIRLITPT